jgi:hypothetical protein
MARKSRGEKAAEKNFLQRSDGDWDYFPRGLSKPGFRVDTALRQKLLAAARANTQQLGLLAASTLALIHFGAPEIARAYPAIAPFALSAVIRVSMGLLILIPLYIFVMRWDKSYRNRLLAQSPIMEPRLSQEDVKAMQQGAFSKLPLRGRVFFFIFTVGVPAWMLYSAWRKFSAWTAVTVTEAMILVLGATLIGLFPVGLLLRRLRAPRKAS